MIEIRKGNVSIVALHEENEEKPILGVKVKNDIVAYGEFYDDVVASLFFEVLNNFIDSKIPKETYEEDDKNEG